MEKTLITFYLTFVAFLIAVVILVFQTLKTCICKYRKKTRTVEFKESDFNIDTELQAFKRDNQRIHSPPPLH